LIPKYFGLYLGNGKFSQSGWNGYMKDWHLCLGPTCARSDDYEKLNCAHPIITADPKDPLSLGPGLPGCEIKDKCKDGMYPPCEVEKKGEASAKIIHSSPEPKPSDLIP
jgi:hypothetical protein